jgi:hypothetical protein
MVTEGTVHVKIPAQTDTNFQLVLGSCVGDDFPVIDSTRKADVCNSASEYVRLFFQENLRIAFLGSYSSAQLQRIPAKRSQRPGWIDNLFRSNLIFEKRFQNFIHFFNITETRMELVQGLAGGRTAGLGAIDGLILNFLAVGVIPTFNFRAFFLMFLKIPEFDNFFAIGVDTLDVKLIIKPEKGFTGDRFDFGIGAFKRTLDSRAFGHPISDTEFTEHFTTKIAVPRFASNQGANKAIKGIIEHFDKALLIISAMCHFVGIV